VKPEVQSTGKITYAQIVRAVQQARGDDAKLDRALGGKDVSARLVKPRGGGDTLAVNAGDPVRFRCEDSDFSGGPINSRVVGVDWSAGTKQAILQLDRCGPAPRPVVAQAAAPAAAPAAPAPAPATAPATASRVGAKPGMDAQGNVIDSAKVEAGSGRTVKGLNDQEGEIFGNPAANSKFAKLQIGMGVRQATDIAGQPTDQGAYITGKAFIPFYFGGDKHRFEMAYKGQGRLVFAGGGMGDFTNGYLIRIIHNPNESGYR
jgi:hypothetical protein